MFGESIQRVAPGTTRTLASAEFYIVCVCSMRLLLDYDVGVRVGVCHSQGGE